MEDEIFEKIIKKEAEANIVYEDDFTLAFLNINPVHKGHTLVIPKKKYRNIFDITKDDLCHLIESVRKVAKAVRASTNADGVNIIQNNESAASQVIFHIHFHIIPRFENDNLEVWPHTKYSSDEEFKEVGRKIRSELQ